ncbi:hypothetical protein [Micromonospora sp. LH3U1]|uniref:hypothetical protein n=1 Tax=Micromonospora sp. LH3U1 TaxID=3018339 RepID=UPI002349D135|nr:hypothetical protein [Micromonospora sp. LH3U1]WCN84302.1 hypothetical protein PCA76_15215 [Micromonospora sp. LH3U1]
MPQLVTVRVERPAGRAIRLWVPVLPVVLVLLPLLILAALGAVVACLVYRIEVLRAFGAGWRLLRAMPGTRVDVREGRTGVLVSVR